MEPGKDPRWFLRDGDLDVAEVAKDDVGRRSRQYRGYRTKWEGMNDENESKVRTFEEGGAVAMAACFG